MSYYTENKEKLTKYYHLRRKDPEVRKGRLVSVAGRRARLKGLEFNLYAKELEWPDYCPLLGIKLCYTNTIDGNRDNSPSIDRKDNTKGYTKENCWVISHKANVMKNNATLEEILLFAENIKKHLKPES